MAVNESFIDSATLRENVVSLARNIGYVPRSKTSSTANISFTVDLNDYIAEVGLVNIPKLVKLKAGLVAKGTVTNGDYIFSVPDDVAVNVSGDGIARFTSIPISEGTLLTKTFTVDDSQKDAKYVLPNANIDTVSYTHLTLPTKA